MVLPEIVMAAIYNSRIVAKDAAVSKNRTTAMFEIELPLERGGVSYIEDHRSPIRPDMIICAKPGQVRHTQFPFKCYYIHMILESGPLYDLLMELPEFFETERAAMYRELFEEIIRCYDTLSVEGEILLQSRVLELIYTLGQDAAVLHANSARKSDRMIGKVVRYIKENLAEDLSLEQVAQTVHLSPIHFHNRFKAAVGKTLRDYVEEQRLKKAIGLLLATDRSLTEIALECGFASQSYFSYVFKRRMHQTPREYVKRLNDRYEKNNPIS